MNVSTEHLSEKELLSQLEQARLAIEIGGIYVHYRDRQTRYKVLGLGMIEATQEPAVIYQKEFGSDGLKSVTWIRSVSSWLEKVSVGCTFVPRFQKIRG